VTDIPYTMFREHVYETATDKKAVDEDYLLTFLQLGYVLSS